MAIADKKAKGWVPTIAGAAAKGAFQGVSSSGNPVSAPFRAAGSAVGIAKGLKSGVEGFNQKQQALATAKAKQELKNKNKQLSQNALALKQQKANIKEQRQKLQQQRLNAQQSAKPKGMKNPVAKPVPQKAKAPKVK